MAARVAEDVYGDGGDADRDAVDACGDVFPSARPRTASSASRASARAYSSTTSGRSPYGVTLRAKKDRRQSPRERDETRPASSGVCYSLVYALSGARCVPTRCIRSLGALRVSRRRSELFRSSSSPAVASPKKRETRKKANNTSVTFSFLSNHMHRAASHPVVSLFHRSFSRWRTVQQPPGVHLLPSRRAHPPRVAIAPSRIHRRDLSSRRSTPRRPWRSFDVRFWRRLARRSV